MLKRTLMILRMTLEIMRLRKINLRKYLKSLQLKDEIEQESEVFSERDGEDAGIDEDADSSSFGGDI